MLKLKKGFNLGFFAFNSSSGSTLTLHTERWKINADKVIRLVKSAEKAGINFLLPVARWNDWGGNTRPHKESYEALSLISCLSSITKKIYLFSTIHTNYIHPIFAARSIVTANHFSNNRVGINIVSGWNKSEYDMFNIKNYSSSDERYKQAAEWLKIFNKLIDPKIDKFNFAGQYFKIKNAQCFPKIIEKNSLIKISAAFSEEGRKFATKHFDILFTMFNSIEKLKETNKKIIQNSGKNKKKIKIFSPVHIICRNSYSEAKDFYDFYSQKKQDRGAVNNFIKNLEWSKKHTLAAFMKQIKQRIAGSLGAFTLIGTPKQIIDQLNHIYKCNTNGVALTFFDFEKDFSYFEKKVLPVVKKF